MSQASPECGQTGLWTVSIADRDGPVGAGHRAVAKAHKSVAPREHLHPVGLSDRSGVGEDRSDGCLSQDPAQVVAGKGCLEHIDALEDQTGVPKAAVLLGERREPAAGLNRSRAPCVLEQHERDQVPDLFTPDLGRKLASGPDGFGGVVDVAGVAFVEG